MNETGSRNGLGYERVAGEGDITIYRVSLPATSSNLEIPQGFRARTTYQPNDTTYGTQRTMEVVINGPGLSKARAKLQRAIGLAVEDRSEIGILGRDGRRHPVRSDRNKSRKVSMKRQLYAPPPRPQTRWWE